MNKLSQYSPMKKDVRTLNRFTSANASDVEIDTAKRILLPTFLLEQVSITKDVMVIGVGDHIEIWDKKTYIKFIEKYYDQYESIAEKIDG
jgi:MraZ protein